jgi:hypothetical protein
MGVTSEEESQKKPGPSKRFKKTVDPTARYMSRRQQGRLNHTGIVDTIQEKSTTLEESIHETEDLLRKVAPGISTQMYQSFHSRKSKFACKDFAWQRSWSARSSAILDVDMSNRRLDLYYHLPLPALHPQAHDVIIADEKKVAAWASQRDMPSERFV